MSTQQTEADLIRESLGRRGIQWVCHMTSCHRLPEIVAHGGLLSLSERRNRGISEPEEPHFWGSPGKEEELASYVVCAFMPPWWMCKKRLEELAIILLDAESVSCIDGVCFCPINSAFNDYSSAEIQAWQGVAAFDECFQNPNTYMAGYAEIFVPGIVPLDMFRGIVYDDDEARDYWGDQIAEAYQETSPQPSLPAGGISAYTRQAPRFGFPGNRLVTTRIRS